MLENIDIKKLKTELTKSFNNEDNMLAVEAIKNIDKTCLSEFNVAKNKVMLIKTAKGFIWKSGILISDLFEKEYMAYKDAKRALL